MVYKIIKWESTKFEWPMLSTESRKLKAGKSVSEAIRQMLCDNLVFLFVCF